MASKGQHIQVFVRCRPLNSHERTPVVEVIQEKHEVKILDRRNNDTKNFYFDQVFGSEAEQIDVYRTVVKPLIDQVLLGFNCTVFAYGQTGTGKTYTMEGDRSTEDLDWENDPHSGMIPRAISQLFDTLKDYDGDFSVRVSFIELYNEDTYDLLSAIDDTTKLRIYDDAQKKGSVIVGNLEEVVVQSKAEIYEILKRGSAKRQTAATLMNACSSRSHTVFTVTVHIKEGSIEGEDVVKIGKLNLVDLAGSENIGRSGAQDKRAREAGNINQSLLTLGRVITALVEKRPHIPYRESKLTRLLQDSLGGKTKTSIIATISPASLDVEDTLSTLDYASRAKKITNKPEMNQRLTKKALLREYTQEIERLRKDLQATREKNGIYVDEENYKEMCKRLAAGDTAVKDKEERLGALQVELERQQKVFDDFALQYEQTRRELDQTIERCQKQKKIISGQKQEKGRLVSHANEIMQVAEIATNDNYLLHGKKERIENILRENRTSIDKYKPIIDDDITRIESLFEVFAKKICDEVNTHHDKLGKEAKTYSELVDRATKAVKLQIINLESESAKDKKLIEDLKLQSDKCTKQAEQLESMARESRDQSNELLEQIEVIVRHDQDLKNQTDSLKKCESVMSVLDKKLSSIDSTNLGSMKDIASTMTSTGKRECHSLRQETETLLIRELKEDVQTGLTPQKKTYEIPSRINLHTSLCDSILEDDEYTPAESTLVLSPTLTST